MSYLGNSPATGENNSFKILDDLTSYTLTFDGSSASVVSLADDTITQLTHRFVTGQRVTYTHGGGTAIGGLTSGSVYYIVKNDQNSIKLAPTYADAIAATNLINFTALGTGTSHTLNVSFDGINTKFVVTYDNGTKAQMTRAAQLQISINGVIQQPQDTSSPTNGFGFDLDSVIVFSTPPVNTDVFWGNLVANNFPTFDIADNTVDSFTGNGSAVSFTLSKSPANNQNVLVTLDGVVQYPSDNYTIRAYSISENVLTFTGAPGNGVSIQARHIGFAGATSSAVTGFYGRTGNVGLTTGDHISVGSISTVGNVNSTGIGTFASLVVNGNATLGIVTATSFNGSGSGLTGVSTNFVASVGIQSAGAVIGAGITQLNFIGVGNTFAVRGTTVDISITSGAGSTIFLSTPTGLSTTAEVGINTTGLPSSLTGIGNSFQGLYISNGMVIMDNTLNGSHYIGTNFNGLMAGPVSVGGTLTIDGVWVVV